MKEGLIFEIFVNNCILGDLIQGTRVKLSDDFFFVSKLIGEARMDIFLLLLLIATSWTT
jgi:hypothetical protein